MPDLLTTFTLALAALLCALSPRWIRRRRAAAQRQHEDILKLLLVAASEGRLISLETLAEALGEGHSKTRQLVRRLAGRGLLEPNALGLQLTAEGRRSARTVLRAHRLWEQFLAQHSGYPEAEWHRQAERIEHELSPEQIESLATLLNRPTRDPHGDPIPGPAGDWQTVPGAPLTEAPVDALLRVEHLEDEPRPRFERMVAAGLHAGGVVEVIDRKAGRLELLIDGRPGSLSLEDAEAVTVAVGLEPAPAVTPHRLADLKPGQAGQVEAVSPRCRGAERRRLLDLGFVPGTWVTMEYAGPFGDPRAYRVRGALIGLRREQSELISITHPEEVAA